MTEHMQLVIYSEAKVEDSLKLNYRLFSFYNHDIHIDQGYLEGGRGGTDSYGFGASVYDACIVLSRYFESQPSIDFNNLSVLEIGCGPGLNSLSICIGKTPSLVVCTDGDEKSLTLSRTNKEKNKDVIKNEDRLQIQLLRWEVEEDHHAALDVNNNNKYDVIIASDVIACPYKENYIHLLNVFDTLLSTASDSAIYMSYQQRNFEEKAFLLAFEKLFDIYYVENDELPKDFQCREAAMPIRLFKATRKKEK